MAKQVKQKRKGNPSPEIDSISLMMLYNSAKGISETKPESAMTMTYPGMDALTKDLAPKTPEVMLEEKSAELKAKWDETIAPHSPLTPEDAWSRSLLFQTGANAIYGGLIALATAAEIGVFGQLETPAFMLPHAPFIEGITSTCVEAMRAYFDATFVLGSRYFALSVHQPTVIPQEYLIQAYNMGLIDSAIYEGQMTYHGYTHERSSVMAHSQIRIPDLSSILELRRRGILTDGGAVDWLVLQRIPRPMAEAAVRLYENVPEAYRLALAAAKHIIPDKMYKDYMKWFGLDEYWSDVWREQNYDYPGFGEATELFWRGVLDDDGWFMWMTRRSLPTDVIDKLRILRELIPPQADLVSMVVREAFLPEMVVESPEVFAKYMAMKGFTKDWSDRYWTAHFLPIGLRQAYENLWRGYWDKDDFMFALHIADVHPRWREDIYNVAFGPLSIREMGYGWDMGILSRDDIVRYRRWGGLSPEDAEKAADSLILYRTAAELEAVRRELLWQFAHERIDEREFIDYLRMYETPEAAIPLWIARGHLQRDRFLKPETEVEYRIVTSSEALWAFKNGLRDEGWLRLRLADLDWTDMRVDLAVQRAKFELEEEAKPAEVVAPRKLTASQLRNLYDAAMIDRDALALALHVEVGYSIEDADILADLWSLPKPAPPIRPYTDAWSRNLYANRILKWEELYDNYIKSDYDEEHAWNMVLATILAEEYPALSAAYRKGVIDQETFLRELIALGMEFDDANDLLERTIRDFQYERIEREKALTKAEILKGVKAAIITSGQAVELLEDIGYDESEAWYVLAIEKMVGAGHPESYWEMRRITESYKKARGEPYVEIPDEVLMLDKAIEDKKKEIEAMKARGESEKAISVRVAELADLEARLRTVLTKLKIE